MSKEKGCYGYSDNGANDFLDCVKKSWTYNSLNKEQQYKLFKQLKDVAQNISHLTYEKQWELLQDIYSTFLYCIRLCNPKIEEKETSETLYNIKVVRDLDGNINLDIEKG